MNFKIRKTFSLCRQASIFKVYSSWWHFYCPKIRTGWPKMWAVIISCQKIVVRTCLLDSCTLCWVFFENSFKDKSPKVPFHRITLSYSYFEELEFLHSSASSKTWSRKNISWTEMKNLLTKPSNVLQKFKFAVNWSYFLERLIWATFN